MKDFKNYQQAISLKGLISSFKNALNGFRVLLKNEYNLYLQMTFAVVAILFGWYFKISSIEWMIQLTAIALVIFSELVNTSIEKIMDFIHPEYDTRVGEIKDMAAAAVLFTVAIAVMVGLFIYIPKVF